MGQRRGRRSHETLLHQAMTLFRQDLIALDGNECFAECRGLLTLMGELDYTTFKRGSALNLLLQGAIADVCDDLYAAGPPHAERLALFLQRWFFEQRTMRKIAEELQLNPQYVGRAIKAQACALAAQRFLDLIQCDAPLAQSPGLREAARLHQERWQSASSRLAGKTRRGASACIRRGPRGEDQRISAEHVDDGSAQAESVLRTSAPGLARPGANLQQEVLLSAGMQ